MTSISVIQKKRGRPKTGQDPVSSIRLSSELRETINLWREQHGVTSESEAIRLLIGRGLALGELSAPTESIVHLGTEFVRGIALTNAQHLEFLDAVTVLYETVDDADDELKETLERLKAEAAGQKEDAGEKPAPRTPGDEDDARIAHKNKP